jgi:2-dehydro-3-deoxyphosphooctonate aldolase (KDO 8-P synthase)
MECHPDPAKAMSDGPNSWPLHKVKALIQQLMAIDEVVKGQPRLEDELASESV